MRLACVCGIGAALFLWPFSGLGVPASTPAMALVLATVLALTVVETGTRRLDTRGLALLAAIAALEAALRLVVVTGIGGFSPIFFLILCAGYVFGPSYGFLVGAASLLVSALVTGGIGPWVPYETLACGWVGMAAGLAGLGRTGPPTRRDIAVLVVVGVGTGFLYGAVMDIWDWLAFRGSADLGWAPGMAAGETGSRFLRYYLTTSLAFDGLRAVGNVVMIVGLGPAVLLALSRFRQRFTLVVVRTPS